jgi:hypothetical protein
MLDGEGGQMRIRHKTARHHTLFDKRGQNVHVRGSGERNPDDIAGEPLLHLSPCHGRRDRALKNRGIAGDPHEGEDGRPGQAHTHGPVEALVQPRSRDVVFRRITVGGVEQQVGVNQNQ